MMPFDPKTEKVVKNQPGQNNTPVTLNLVNPQLLKGGNLCLINLPNTSNSSENMTGNDSKSPFCVLQSNHLGSLPIINPNSAPPSEAQLKALKSRISRQQSIKTGLLNQIKERDEIISQLVDRVNNAKKKKHKGKSNINTYLEMNPNFAKVLLEEGYKIVCKICETKPNKVKKRGLSQGLVIDSEKAANILTDGHIQWRCLKRQLKKHLLKHESDDGDVHVMKCQLSACLQLIKMKASNKYYPYLLSLCRLFGVNVTERNHRVGAILAGLKSYAMQRLHTYMSRPIVAAEDDEDGARPHYALSIGRCTVYKASYYAVMIILNLDGARKAIPVDCALMQQNSSDNSGRELVELIGHSLRNTLKLSNDDIWRLSAIYTDGQYSPEFYGDLKAELNIDSSSYFLSIWDPCQWIDGSFKNTWESVTFFKNLVKRLENFNDKFQHGKTGEVFRAITKLLDTKGQDVASANRTKFCSAILEYLNHNFETFTTLADSALARPFQDLMSNLEEWREMLVDTELWMDLCAVIDVLTPISEVILKLQQINVAPWKVLNYCPRVLAQLSLMEAELVACVDNHMPTATLFPTLNNKWHDVQQCRNINTRITALEEEPSMQAGADVSGDGDLHSHISDYVELCGFFKHNLQSYLNSFTSSNLVAFKNCFDVETMLRELASLSEVPEWQKKTRLERYFSRGLDEFLDFYRYLLKKPFLKDSMDPDVGARVFRQWKDLFYDLTLRSKTSQGDFFYNKEGEYLKLSSKIELITLKSEGVTQIFYDLKLENGDIHSNVQFHERNFFSYITGDVEFLKSRDLLREFHYVLDYVFSTFATEGSFEVFFNLMRSHEKDGRFGDYLSSRAIVDFMYPYPIQCDATLRAVSRKFVTGDDSLEITSHNLSAEQRSRLQRQGTTNSLDSLLANDEEPRVPIVLCGEDATTGHIKLGLVDDKDHVDLDELEKMETGSTTDDDLEEYVKSVVTTKKPVSQPSKLKYFNI